MALNRKCFLNFPRHPTVSLLATYVFM